MKEYAAGTALFYYQYYFCCGSLCGLLDYHGTVVVASSSPTDASLLSGKIRHQPSDGCGFPPDQPLVLPGERRGPVAQLVSAL